MIQLTVLIGDSGNNLMVAVVTLAVVTVGDRMTVVHSGSQWATTVVTDIVVIVVALDISQVQLLPPLVLSAPRAVTTVFAIPTLTTVTSLNMSPTMASTLRIAHTSEL